MKEERVGEGEVAEKDVTREDEENRIQRMESELDAEPRINIDPSVCV